MTSIQISDVAYQQLLQAAQQRNISLEQFIEELASQAAQMEIYADDTAFFHALGATDEDLKRVDELVAHLPDTPDW